LFTFGGLAFGLGLGIGLALLLEMRDTTLRSERDVEFFLKLPMLAIVPALEVTVSHSRSGHSTNGNGNQPAFTDSRVGIRG
jgi:hypothetical protein